MFSVMRAEVKRRGHPAMRRNAGAGGVCSAPAFCYPAQVSGDCRIMRRVGVGQDKPVVGGGTG